jgi:hypothetical protein
VIFRQEHAPGQLGLSDFTDMRDHQYKRHGIATLMARVDLLSGHTHAPLKGRHHRSPQS